ncbi:circadian clock protein KaiC [Nannocystis exedens]|uniref:non-specific serine/threonine protein kinase n=1 Tax=Nannocystis exedens TaxID=54 RepID=A0A1I2CV97_9BACT|nr:ATPase domain-containing protein [Nannocystis exedens]PCC68605.1 circadian clock protein KaiC [Nannocystis exedens]SFE72226.1 circadian clock protein KaiC [Nannocystis exedens]
MPFSQPRAPTGISGLDDILGGGLPIGHLYLFEGSPGTGKTTFGLQFLLAGRDRGEAGLYITLSETRDELAVVAASHGWSLDGIRVFELLSPTDLSAAAEQSILHPSEVELGETVDAVIRALERERPARVVFDSLSEMRMLAQDPLRYRRQILALKHYFARRECTVMMLDDRTTAHQDLQLHSIAHGVLCLEQQAHQYGPARRHLRVSKMRGLKYRSGDHDFEIRTGGIEVYPRLVAAEHRVPVEHALVSTGNAALDSILGGGLVRGTSVLFSGPSGAGKTTTALSCVEAALRRGERCAFYLFDESLSIMLQRAAALGIDVREYAEAGTLELRQLDPAEMSAGEFAHRARRAVEAGVKVVVIDSLNAYLHAMPGSRFLVLQMHELLAYLSQQGVITILILGQHGLLGEGRSDVDLSYLSDSLLLFRYFEARGRLLKALSVTKSRTNAHESTIREFRLTERGVEVGDVLLDFHGVLSGIPHYDGVRPLLSDGDDAPASEA